MRRVTVPAVFAGFASGGPLCMMARSKRLAASGRASRAAIVIAPADSPITVTRLGSPPNAQMLRRTQRSAAIWSARPRFASPSAKTEKPSAPRR